jgi:uncharacterized protein (UPF0303 family)
MDIAAYESEAAELIFPRFGGAEALALGREILALTEAGRLPVAIDVRGGGRTWFHASLPGAQPLNDLWARRKSNTVLMFGEASMMVALRFRAKGQDLSRDGLDTADYVLSGGAVPVVVKGMGVVAVATVSGLPEEEDHALVVRAMRKVLAAIG